MSALFVETSALLRLVLREKGAAEVEERISKASRLLASRLIKVEAERALIRVALDRPEIEGMLPVVEGDLRGIWAKMDFFEISVSVCDLAGRISPRSSLRTLDAIHLATYLRARELYPDAKMLSFDDRILAQI